MDPINRLNRLLETLRQQIAESARRSDTSRTQTSPSQSGNGAVKLALPELRRRIQDRIQGVEPTTPEGQRQAKRLFLESVLVWEFGDNLLLDKQYQHMLDNIQATIESDPDTDKQFTALVTDLSRR